MSPRLVARSNREHHASSGRRGELRTGRCDTATLRHCDTAATPCRRGCCSSFSAGARTPPGTCQATLASEPSSCACMAWNASPLWSSVAHIRHGRTRRRSARSRNAEVSLTVAARQNGIAKPMWLTGSTYHGTRTQHASLGSSYAISKVRWQPGRGRAGIRGQYTG
jgi:hypothetical protein